MENIDVPATLELLAGILIVLGIAATFFKKTKVTPTETVEEAPYKVETPAPVEVDQTAVVVAAEASAVEIPAKKTRKPRAPKAETAKTPAVKKPRAKKV
jgi:ABC-type xylose transport system permease subunit